MITEYILQHTKRLVLTPHPPSAPNQAPFEMFNTAGVECEIGEFLYSLVRLHKPKMILETGTHIGVSSSYMGLALERNKRGNLITFEVIQQHLNSARALWADLGLLNRCLGLLQDAATYDPMGLDIDLLFLDSEPHLRYAEFVKFWPFISPGGLVVIHDLNGTLGHSGLTVDGMYDWPFGDFRKSIGPYIERHEVQTFSWLTPRGFSVFQKESPEFAYTKYLKGTL